MADAAKIREVIEAVVTQVLDAQIPVMRDEIVDRVLQELQPVLASQSPQTELLKTAVAAIHEATTQTEILKAMLDGAADFCGRAALFVMRGGTAMGWQARGFRDNDAVKILSVDTAAGLAGFAMQQRTAVAGPTAQFDSRFVAGFGAPLDGQCLLLPLIIRDKVAALVYADSGAQADTSRPLDACALDLLVHSSGLWVELLALRKSAGVSQPAAPAAAEQPAAPSPLAAPAGAPAVVAQPQSYEPVPVAVVAYSPPATSAPPPDRAAAASVPAAAPDGSAPAGEEELHRKARRFAKLLVDEIKLYNKAKVTEGKQNHDLYDRLKDDIEKSRATYDKRYGQTSAAASDYFSQELVRSLADSNPVLLGSNFSR